MITIEKTFVRNENGTQEFTFKPNRHCTVKELCEFAQVKEETGEVQVYDESTRTSFGVCKHYDYEFYKGEPERDGIPERAKDLVLKFGGTVTFDGVRTIYKVSVPRIVKNPIGRPRQGAGLKKPCSFSLSADAAKLVSNLRYQGVDVNGEVERFIRTLAK